MTNAEMFVCLTRQIEFYMSEDIANVMISEFMVGSEGIGAGALPLAGFGWGDASEDGAVVIYRAMEAAV